MDCAGLIAVLYDIDFRVKYQYVRGLEFILLSHDMMMILFITGVLSNMGIVTRENHGSQVHIN